MSKSTKISVGNTVVDANGRIERARQDGYDAGYEDGKSVAATLRVPAWATEHQLEAGSSAVEWCRKAEVKTCPSRSDEPFGIVEVSVYQHADVAMDDAGAVHFEQDRLELFVGDSLLTFDQGRELAATILDMIAAVEGEVGTVTG